MLHADPPAAAQRRLRHRRGNTPSLPRSIPTPASVASLILATLAMSPLAVRASATAGFAASSRRGAAASTSASASASASSSGDAADANSADAKPPLYRDGSVSVTRRSWPRSAPAAAPSWTAAVLGGRRGRKKKKRRQAIADSSSSTGAAEEGGTKSLEVFNMWYRVYRPDLLVSGEKAPLLVIHGGPSLPSDYIRPLASYMPPGRAVVFYDQIGCGRSDEPEDFGLYGIPQSVDDLEVLVDHLGLRRFHLLGHSFGGALAYSYLRRVAEGGLGAGSAGIRRPLSVILSNASTSMRLSDDERTRLLNEVKADRKRRPEKYAGLTVHDAFFRRNQCRTDGVPPCLAEAFRRVGSVWCGTDVVMDWVATAPSSAPATSVALLPPLLILRGEHDFVTKKCTEGWAELFGGGGGGDIGNGSNGDGCVTRERVLGGCAHYSHLEAPELYGRIVESHCAEHDAD